MWDLTLELLFKTLGPQTAIALGSLVFVFTKLEIKLKIFCLFFK